MWKFISRRDHGLMRRVHRWRAPRWIRLWSERPRVMVTNDAAHAIPDGPDCVLPSGEHIGRPFRLMPWQTAWINELYA